jgi:cytochrome c-type biogenesis protein CcmH/NrfG
VLLGGAVAALAAGTAGTVLLVLGPRHAGQAVTGNVPLTGQQQVAAWLAQAAVDVNGDQLGPAAVLYTRVLAQDPSNEVALAQLGYLEYRTGIDGNDASLVAQGTSMLHRAVNLVPGDFAARLYLGTVLFQHDHDAAGAVVQYRSFLADDPPASVLAQAAPVVRQAFTAAGQPVPTGVPAG